MADRSWNSISPHDHGCIVAAKCAASSYVPPLTISDYSKAWTTALAPGKGPIYQVKFKAQASEEVDHTYLGFAWKKGSTDDTMEPMSCQLVDEKGET